MKSPFQIWLIIFISIITINVYSQEVSRESNYEKYIEWELMAKNKVKTIRIYNDIGDDNSFKLTAIKEYDISGKGLGCYYFDNDSNIIAYDIYKYHKDTLVEEKNYFKFFRPEIDRIVKYIYNEHGQLIEMEYVEDIDPVKITYIYDSTGMLVRDIYCLYSKCGRITHYIYDENKNLLREEIRDTSNNPIENYIYRDNGRIRTRIISEEDDSLVYISNEMGDEIEYLNYSKGKIERQSITSRNKNGYWESYIEYEDGLVSEFHLRKYNKKEQVVLEEHYKKNKLQFREITEYDSNGLKTKVMTKSKKKKNNKIMKYKYYPGGLMKSIKTLYPNNDSQKNTKFIYEYYP